MFLLCFRWCALALLVSAGPIAAQDKDAARPAATTVSSLITPAATEPRPPIIPIADFAGRSALYDPLMSPDGRFVAVRTFDGDQAAINVIDVETRKSVAAARLGEPIEYEWHRWAGSRVVLISVSMSVTFLDEETRMTRILALDVATGKRWFVGPNQMGPDGDEVLYVAPDGSSLLLSYQTSIWDWPSVHRVSLLSDDNKGEQVQRSIDGVWQWVADDIGVVRMGMGWTGRKLRITYRKNAEERFREIARIGEDDDDRYWDVMRIVSGSDEGYSLIKQDNGHVALVRVNYATRQPVETVYANPDWDITGAWLDKDGKPLSANFTDDRDRRVWFDPAMAKLQLGFEKALKVDEVWIGSRSQSSSRMLVFAGGEVDPGVLYVYDAPARTLEVFATFRPAIDPALLARPQPISYTARDGTNIRGYLTLPRGRAAKGLPLIILPHGGPYGVRDKLDYDDEVQILANRGYAVLQPNYRGSGGYGESFEKLGNGQIGRAMQDDIDDAMDWAVKAGIADPARVCVVGSSYGGYAAMWAAIRNPERYRCAASFAGVSDWKRQLRYDRNFFSARGSRKWRDRVRGEDEFDLDLVAPARTIGRLTRPLLVAHGTKDSNVPFSQHKLVRKAAAQAGVPIEELVLEGEGHGFYLKDSKGQWFEKLTAFLARHNPAD